MEGATPGLAREVNGEWCIVAFIEVSGEALASARRVLVFPMAAGAAWRARSLSQNGAPRLMRFWRAVLADATDKVKQQMNIDGGSAFCHRERCDEMRCVRRLQCS